MKRLNLSLFAFALTFMPMAAGCVATNPNLPNPGFTIVTVRINSLGIDAPVPGTLVSGYTNRPPALDATGTKTSFPQTASSYPSGLVPVRDGVAPAFWALSEHNGPCAGQTAFGGVKRGDFNYLTCAQVRLSLPFTFSPLRIDAEAASVTWILKGDNMHTTYGMPIVQFYDMNGILVAQTQATAIAGDNSWIEGNSLILQTVPSGVYLVQAWNMTPDGGEFCGHTTMNVYRTSELPPDQDGDSYRADVDCNDNDASIYPDAGTRCGSGEDWDCNGIDDYNECYEGNIGGGGGGECCGPGCYCY